MLPSLFDTAPGLQGGRQYKYILRAVWGTAPRPAGGVETPTARCAARLSPLILQGLHALLLTFACAARVQVIPLASSSPTALSFFAFSGCC